MFGHNVWSYEMSDEQLRTYLNAERPETAYNDLQRTGSNFMEPLYLKDIQQKGLNITKKQ